jgi:ABC-type branched-subunit amino acid transport system ATPase component
VSEKSLVLEVSDLISGYDNFDVLQGVSMKVYPGEIISIIGPNGCGKSTFFKTLFGILRNRKGEIKFQGDRIDHLPPVKRLQKGITYVPQGRSNFPFMTVEENLEMGGFIQEGLNLREKMDALYKTFPILEEKRYQPARTLSGGQQQILEMAMRLIHNPQLMLVDEPSLGLDPQNADLVFDILRNLNEHGMAVILVEQNAVRALKCSHRAYVLEQGKNRYEGTAEEILHSEEVKRLYLGGG